MDRDRLRASSGPVPIASAGRLAATPVGVAERLPASPAVSLDAEVGKLADRYDLDGSLAAGTSALSRAATLVEKANADLEPELLDSEAARDALAAYARIRRLADFGIAAVARKVDDASLISRATGTPIGQAKATIDLGRNLKAAPELGAALQSGTVSAEQAREIASAEASSPGVVAELVRAANEQPFHAFKDKARRTKLEAEQHHGLAAKQHAARSARHYSDELGMTHIHLTLKPLAATPIVNGAEADAQRL